MNTLVRLFFALFVAARLFGAGAEPAAVPVTATTDYVLQPGDTVAVIVLGESDLSKQMEALKIAPDGTITIPFFERAPIQTKAKTRQQLAAIITGLYKSAYLRDPQITVRMVSYVPREVNVLGQVGSPRKVLFPIEGRRLTLINAITECGGFTRLADAKRVVLTRVTPDGTIQKVTIDARPLSGEKAGGSGKEQNDWPLQPDDIIYVPEI
jgi:protein involved in polysaccharide export with SLBB domain